MIGWILIFVGMLIIVFSGKIVFPGLERLVGIEMIVGSQNVVYEPDGGYAYTNPGAMLRWIGSVAAFGILVCFAGIWGIFRERKLKR